MSASKILHWFQNYTKDLVKRALYQLKLFPTEILLLLSLDIYIPVAFNASVQIRSYEELSLAFKVRQRYTARQAKGDTALL